MVQVLMCISLDRLRFRLRHCRLHAALAVPDEYSRAQQRHEQAAPERQPNRKAGASVLGCLRVAGGLCASAR